MFIKVCGSTVRQAQMSNRRAGRMTRFTAPKNSSTLRADCAARAAVSPILPACVVPPWRLMVRG
ncbi:hypothetical protein GCM10010280_56340 [Streptomyces pilosus]|uniref:Uncharacterized protein n=1 Tax=Streptomyces pilosus TaxID=28893 RepID=A0A918C2D1_9ACTN|nr:hypothetical protein GCM10010280_56340 [Streptomyces pilosus]